MRDFAGVIGGLAVSRVLTICAVAIGGMLGAWAVNQFPTSERIAHWLSQHIPGLRNRTKLRLSMLLVVAAVAVALVAQTLDGKPEGGQRVDTGSANADGQRVFKKQPALVATCPAAPDLISALALDERANRAYAATVDGEIWYYNTRTASCAPTDHLDSGQRSVNALTVDADSGLLYSGGEDGTIRTWQQDATGAWAQQRAIKPSTVGITTLLLTDRGLFAGDGFGNVRRFDAVTLEEQSFGEGAAARLGIDFADPVLDLAAEIRGPAWSVLFVALADGSFQSIDVDDAVVTQTSAIDGVATGVASLASGRIAQVGRTSAQIWDVVHHAVDPTLSIPLPDDRQVLRVRSSGDGRIVAFGDDGGWAVLWDVASGDITSVHNAKGSITAIAVSLDGRLLVTAASNQVAVIYKVDVQRGAN